VPIYSGGLGVLSGDHIKAPADWASAGGDRLFYDQGYFKQHLDAEGYQREEYLDTKVENVPMEPARDPAGKHVTVTINTRTGVLLAKVWLMRVGRVNLYLWTATSTATAPKTGT